MKPVKPVSAGLQVVDPYRTTYPNVTVVARFLSGNTAADELSIISVGAGNGQINLSGSDVRFGSLVIGQFATLPSRLEVQLNDACTLEALQALLRSIGFFNTSDAPSITPRTISMSLAGPFGLVEATRGVEITPVNDSPTLANGTLVVDEDIAFPVGASISNLLEVDSKIPMIDHPCWVSQSSSIHKGPTKEPGSTQVTSAVCGLPSET